MLQKLKDSVELKFGRKISYQKDCKQLSDCILKEVSGVVSPSTLRRFFGFLSTNSNPSRATLDILSAYCGYNDWDNFREKNSNVGAVGESVIDLWLKAKDCARLISIKNFDNIKKQNQVGYSNSVSREFVDERIANFLQSSYKATAFIGPGGYGKTTLLTKWYEDKCLKTKNNNDIILFLPTSALENWVGKEIYLEKWISSLIGFSTSALFDSFRSNSQLAPGQFILILDALDDMALNLSKTEKIFNALHELILNLPSEWFRLIVSSRHSTWEHFISLSTSNESWFFTSNEHFITENSNIPSLVEKEIQYVLDKTINVERSKRIFTQELNRELLQIISYPLFLQIFIETTGSNSSKLYVDRVDLISEYLKKELFQKQFPDEKLDILNKIIELSDFTGCSIKKNDLKNIFPIHLKLSGNYYNAYEQLVSFGIITEKLEESQFGVLTNKVRITQQYIYNHLYLLKLIDNNGSLSFKLFEIIEQKFKGTEQQIAIICLLFEMAYKLKQVDTLKMFFSLSHQTLEKVFELPIIHRIISTDEFMQRELIPEYSKDRKARKYLMESYIDINSINTSYKFLIENYIKNAKDEREIFIGETLQNISKIYELKFDWISQFRDKQLITQPLDNITPLIAGFWFTCSITNEYFKVGSLGINVEKNIDEFKANNASKWSIDDDNNFELAMILGFLVAKRYDIVTKRLTKHLKNKTNTNLSSEEKTLTLYLEYSKWREKSLFDTLKMKEIEEYTNDMPTWISHQTYIIINSWFAMYQFSQGKMENAYDLYRNTVEMSNIAGYKIFELKLLKNLSTVLRSIGEEEKADECNVFIKSLAKESNVKFSLL